MTLFFLVWVVWFFTATWVENTTAMCKNRFAKGVRAMKKLGSLLTLLFLGACVILPKPAAAQDQTAQDQSVQDQNVQDQNVQDQNAPDETPQDQTADPPSRVARLSYTKGSVSYQVSGDSDWVNADPNRPLTTNDNLWSDKDSLGEVHIGSTAIRLSSNTGISILNLDDRTAQFQLAQGTIEVHLRNLEAGDAWEFDTPNLSFTLSNAGEYLVSTDPNSNVTTIVVREAARPGRKRFCFSAIRFPRRRWLLSARFEWDVERSARLRPGLDSEQRSRRLGALSNGTLGLDRALGLDMGGR